MPAATRTANRRSATCWPSCARAFPWANPRAPSCAAIGEVAREIAAHGSFNFILSDGELLFAHCSTHLHYVIREYPFSVAQLIDCERSIDFRQHNHLDDRIAVIATHPLTQNEDWLAFAPGELKLFAGGALLPANESAQPGVYIQISY